MDQTLTLKIYTWYACPHLGLQLYGKDWKKIEALVATRNGAQIRSHAQKYFIKLRKEEGGDELENEMGSLPDNTSPVTQLPPL